MPVNDVLAQLQQLLRGATPLVEGAERLPETFLKLTPGQQVSGTVLSQQPSGRFLVQVNGQHLDLNLPRDTQPGAQVTLRFLASEPRLTFVLVHEAGQARPAVNLSDAARHIGALLARANSLTGAGAATAASVPVVDAPPTDPQKLALALKTSLSESGLFYEAHQAQWVSGERSLAALLREPQAQLSQPRAFALAQDQVAKSPLSAASSPATPLPAAQGPDGVGAGGGAQPAPAPREPVHPQTAPLVQQQLETLDTRQIVWQGEAWPGQTLRWEIEEREGGSEHGAPAERQWFTRLALTLPLLGEVQARLRLDALGVHVELVVQEAHTRARLARAADDLQAGFARAGLTLARFQVAGDG
ncbi:flagellar hook-length control protein FliK [Thiobacter aerophilum]|uniref:Flagellar hook-length control protein FliK n=1 Tax=Thiobacter aerophilum TaxID=3121275 RepID=A0ABV0EE79_9BURK